jgi:signal transduction histidine kinase
LAFAAAAWALILGLLITDLHLVGAQYDYMLDLAFAGVVGLLLYYVVSRDLLKRAAAQQAAINEAWRAANEVLETRVAERTTGLENANKALQAEIIEHARAEQELTSLLELSRQLSSTFDQRCLLGLILEHVERMIGYSSATIWRYEGGALTLLDQRGILPQERTLQDCVATGLFPSEEAAIVERRPVIVNEVEGDSDSTRACIEGGNQRLLGTRLRSRSGMGVPLIVEGHVIGLLCLDHELPDYFTPQHARLVMIIANQAAVAVQNAISYEAAQRAAVVNERARLARDLHDSIIQAVYGMMWSIRTAHTVLPSDTARAAKLLERALATTRACLNDLRALIFELRPELLEQYGLAGLLARHAETVQATGLIDFITEIADEPELPLRSKEALYRIAQEAMQNAVKHSQASQVKVRLCQDPDVVSLEVRDDGIGFDPNSTSPGQFGLISMRERAAQVGGQCEITSSLGRGTRIYIRVPIQPVRAAA